MVISRQLECDESFLKQAKSLFQKVSEESNVVGVNLDPSFFWLKSKTAIISLAKHREREIKKEENFRVKIIARILFLNFTRYARWG